MEPIVTHFTLLDRHNPDPARRSVKSQEFMFHQWHNLKRGDKLPNDPDMVIVGFWRGKGGMYASYGPSINEVSGWRIISATQAKSPK